MKAATGRDRIKGMRSLQVATLFGLRRAVRNGSVWVDHSLVFRGRARLFFTPERRAGASECHHARLDMPADIATVREATVDTGLFEQHRDTLVRLAASVMRGNAGAVSVLARFEFRFLKRPLETKQTQRPCDSRRHPFHLWGSA